MPSKRRGTGLSIAAGAVTNLLGPSEVEISSPSLLQPIERAGFERSAIRPQTFFS